MEFQVEALRSRFPALARRHGERTAVFLDGPAGTQVPQSVIEAISDYLVRCNANHGGCFATSVESDALLGQVHQAVADLLNCDDPGAVSFGANMTSLAMALSRALARQWRAGDEVIVTRLDHDANVTPWVLAARDTGAVVRRVELMPDCSLNLDDFRSKLSDRTRLVAVTCASNATGGVVPVREICEQARQAGALTVLDAVHLAPHRRPDVQALGGDFLLCSAYKFFGPHIGVMWGRRELLESIEPYKLRPAGNQLPDRWMTGTQNHECLAGVLAAVDYLADVGRLHGAGQQATRPKALATAYQAIQQYETSLCDQLLQGLAALPEIAVRGVESAGDGSRRVSTISITHQRLAPAAVARQLADRGVFVWHGNYYALSLTEALGLEPEGMVRLGLLHYNTEEEVAWLLRCLKELR